MSDIAVCPVCGCEDVEPYSDKTTPFFQFPVPRELIGKIDERTIYFKICNYCSHVFQTKIDRDLINAVYSIFYKHYNLDTSEQFQEVYLERFKKFFIRNLSSGKLLDIGCSKAPLFPFFESLGFECYGIEPSKEDADIAKKNNPNSHISNIFFEASKGNVFGEKFDVIQMNFVMEHIVELDVFFERLKMYIMNGTRIFVQVPDVEYYIKNNIDPFCACEHINYFTHTTLRTLLERNGFEVHDILHGDISSILLCAEYQNAPRIEVTSNEEEVLHKKEFIRDQTTLADEIIRIVKKEEHLVMYGLGITAFWILGHCGDSFPEKLMLIDDNKFYKGKIVPGFNLEVQPCPKIKLDGALILITTSPPYFSRIKEKIRDNITGKYRIGYVQNNEIVIEEVGGIH